MPLEIPLRSDLPLFDLQVTLEDRTYTLEFRWNTRERDWYMNLLTEEGDDIILGIKVVVDFPLGRRSRHPLRPPGAFIAVDTTGQKLDPQFDELRQVGDLGDRVSLLYFTGAELAAISSA